MKKIRFVPVEGKTRVTVTLRETDELVVVTPDGLETTDAATIRALDAHSGVERQKAPAANAATTSKQKDGQS